VRHLRAQVIKEATEWSLELWLPSLL